MKKNKLLALILIFTFTFAFSFGENALAAKKSSSKGLEKEELVKVTESVDKLMKKIYSSALFSPEDAGELFDIKAKLDTVIGAGAKEQIYPRLFYDLAYLCKEREHKEDAVQYYKIVTDYYADSPYANRARSDLKKLGIKIDDHNEDL